jgi:hypothetical protein
MAAGYQFIHIDTAGMSPSKNRSGTANNRTVGELIGEASRDPEYCHHLPTPRPPEVIFGKPLASLGAQIGAAVADARTAGGKRVRKDAQVLIAGVASFPSTWEEIDADPAEKSRYERWQSLTLDFLKSEFLNLDSVVLHTDEARPHLHFFVAARPDQKKGLSLDSIHPGLRAEVRALEEGADKRAAAGQKIEALRGFQDRFYTQVGQFVGLTRTGPGRSRSTRQEWKNRQEEASRRAEELRELGEIVEAKDEAERTRTILLQDAARRSQDLDQRTRSVAERERVVAEAERKIKKEWEAVANLRQQLAQVFATIRDYCHRLGLKIQQTPQARQYPTEKMSVQTVRTHAFAALSQSIDRGIQEDHPAVLAMACVLASLDRLEYSGIREIEVPVGQGIDWSIISNHLLAEANRISPETGGQNHDNLAGIAIREAEAQNRAGEEFSRGG